MKSSDPQEPPSLWQQFCEDERASAQSCWGVLVFLVWIATQSLLAFS